MLPRTSSGFSILEALVATVMTMVVMGAALVLAERNVVVAGTAPEMVDEQQRARAGADLIVRDLLLAGAGMSVGPRAGTLGRYLAPVLPRRIGASGDPFNTARSDAISSIYVSTTNAQSRLLLAMTSPADGIQVDATLGCPHGTQVCGLQQASTAILFDDAGRFDLVDVLSLNNSTAVIAHRQQGPLDFTYQTGDSVAEAESHTYYFDRPALQLRHFDGSQSDVPVLDNVVDVMFEYFGDPAPPTRPKPPLGTANCLYDATGASTSGLGTLSAGQELVDLPLSMFTDGPWCAFGSNRYDADLLRVRLVRVTLRVQVANPMLRGTSQDFAVAGLNRSAVRLVPDYTVRIDVAARNMSMPR